MAPRRPRQGRLRIRRMRRGPRNRRKLSWRRVLDCAAMKRIMILALGAVAAMVLVTAVPTAQVQPSVVVFVDSQALIAAHPAGQSATELRLRAQAEVEEVRQQLDAIQQRARGGALPPEDTERFNVLLITYEDLQTRYQAEIAQAAAPAIEAVNEAIRAESAENGYTVVLDIAAAAQSGLVVYAAEGTDITDAVMTRLGN
jgi:outer membrane protein